MANVTIPQLPAAITVLGPEQIEIVQPAGGDGTSKRATLAQIAGLASPSAAAVSAQSITANGTLTIDYSQGSHVILTLAGNVTAVSMVNFAPSGLCRLSIEMHNTGNFTITGWPSLKWPNGLVPSTTQGSGAIDWYAITTSNGGSTLYGQTIGQSYS